MHQTKFKYEKKKKKTQGNYTKIKQAKVTVHVHCTPPLMRSIHPQNFITIAIIVLEICTGQKSSLKVNKGQSLKKKRKQELWFMCTALPLDEIYPPTKFQHHS